VDFFFLPSIIKSSVPIKKKDISVIRSSSLPHCHVSLQQSNSQ